MSDNLIERLSDEAEFCKQVGVFSIAKLLDEARAAIERQSVPQPQPVQQEPGAWQSIESMAVERYKVVPSHESMFYRHAVVAGNGMQQLFLGRETECANMARKFAGAFLDGAHAATKGTT